MGDTKEKINFGTFIGYIIEQLEKDDEFIDINPFNVLNINEADYKGEKSKEFSEKFTNFNYFKNDRNKFLAHFILENNNMYERHGNIYKLKKDHFYYTIMNDLNNLKKILKNNELLIFEKDKFQRTLLYLSVILNNYEITKYLLTTEININGLDIITRTPTDISDGRILDLLKRNGGLSYDRVFYNGRDPYIYNYAIGKGSDFNLIDFIYKQLLKKIW